MVSESVWKNEFLDFQNFCVLRRLNNTFMRLRASSEFSIWTLNWYSSMMFAEELLYKYKLTVVATTRNKNRQKICSCNTGTTSYWSSKCEKKNNETLKEKSVFEKSWNEMFFTEYKKPRWWKATKKLHPSSLLVNFMFHENCAHTNTTRK